MPYAQLCHSNPLIIARKDSRFKNKILGKKKGLLTFDVFGGLRIYYLSKLSSIISVKLVSLVILVPL